MSREAPLRILLVPSAYYPETGGIEETTRRLALELERRGHHAMVLTNRWPSWTARTERIDGIEVRRVRFDLPAARLSALVRFARVAPWSAVQLVRIVRGFRPDVVHLMGAGPNAAYVTLLRGALGAPVVLSAHGEFRNDAHFAFRRSRALRLALRRLLRHAAAITAPSRVVLEELAEEFQITAPTTVIPNAVEPAEFDVPRPRDARIGPYVFAAGRLVEQKGIDVLLQAFAQAEGPLAQRRLVIAGDGPEKASLAALADRLGIAARVSFVGAVLRPRLVELMRGADAFAFPSRKEAFGVALLEAMAAGTPAVATRVGGIPDFARDGENALLVAADDPARLAVALERLLAEPELSARLAAGGRKQAGLHAWVRLAPRYEELYATAADG